MPFILFTRCRICVELFLFLFYQSFHGTFWYNIQFYYCFYYRYEKIIEVSNCTSIVFCEENEFICKKCLKCTQCSHMIFIKSQAWNGPNRVFLASILSPADLPLSLQFNKLTQPRYLPMSKFFFLDGFLVFIISGPVTFAKCVLYSLLLQKTDTTAIYHEDLPRLRSF